jgi:hypothetical protein
LTRVYSGQLVRVQEWLKRAPGVHLLPVAYAQVLSEPAGTAKRLAEFRGKPFDEAAAAACWIPGCAARCIRLLLEQIQADEVDI